MTNVVLPLDQGPSAIASPKRSVYRRRRSRIESDGVSLSETDSQSSHHLAESPWAQPNALKKLLAWNALAEVDDLEAISENGYKSEISTSFCFSTIKDGNQLFKSELISAISVSN